MATDNKIQVQTQTLKNTASEMRKINKNLNNKLVEINKDMNSLESTWQSSSAMKIRQSMNKLKPRFDAYNSTVEKYCKFLDSAAKAYEDLEKVYGNNVDGTFK